VADNNVQGVKKGEVKIITTGLQGKPVISHSGASQVHMTILPPSSNGATQGYQLLTFATPANSQHNPQQMSRAGSVDRAKTPTAQKKEISFKQSGGGQNYSAIIQPNTQIIMGHVPNSSAYKDVGKADGVQQLNSVSSLHQLNTVSGLPLSMFTSGIQPHLLAFHSQASASPSKSQKPTILAHQGTKPGRASSPPRPAHTPTPTPVPRIFTPTPGSGSTNPILTDLQADPRATGQMASPLLIQSGLSQLSGTGAFNPAGHFNHQAYAADHRGLALVGIGPDQTGDARTIRLPSGYQGLASQRLAMYTDQATALRQNFPAMYRPGGEWTTLLLHVVIKEDV